MKYVEQTTILTGMPSLIAFNPFPYFQQQWPLSKQLPSLKGFENKENDGLINLEQVLQHKGQIHLFEPRISMQVTGCEHKNRKHYAKNMCQTCYHNQRKRNKITQCGHADRKVFARNMCCSCYSSAYKKYVKGKLEIKQ